MNIRDHYFITQDGSLWKVILFTGFIVGFVAGFKICHCRWPCCTTIYKHILYPKDPDPSLEED